MRSSQQPDMSRYRRVKYGRSSAGMKTGEKSPSSPRGMDTLSSTKSRRKRHPVASSSEYLALIRLATIRLVPSRSPATWAVCPCRAAFPAAPEPPSKLLWLMGIVVRVANSFTASKAPPFQALKGWCRIHMVGGTGRSLLHRTRGRASHIARLHLHRRRVSRPSVSGSILPSHRRPFLP